MLNLDIKAMLEGAAAYGVLSAAVRSLPDPTIPTVGFLPNLYLWMFRFLHACLSNYDKLRSNPVN